MIILKVGKNQEVKNFVFLDKDKKFANSHYNFYKKYGYEVSLEYKIQKITLNNLFKIIDDIVDEGKEHASEFLPELKKRLKGDKYGK